jgi:hypothetical protein
VGLHDFSLSRLVPESCSLQQYITQIVWMEHLPVPIISETALRRSEDWSGLLVPSILPYPLQFLIHELMVILHELFATSPSFALFRQVYKDLRLISAFL